jgi:hypothetical protein
MNPSAIKILLHLGAIIKAGKDFENLVADAIAGKNVKEDVKSCIEDLSSLFSSGLLSVSGLSSEQAVEAFKAIEAAF